MTNLRFLLWGPALVGGALTACVSLDEQLVGTVTTTYFSTPAGLEAAVDGDYAQLRDFFGREESFAVTEFGTDLTSNGDQGAYQFENTYAAGLNAGDGHYQFPWTSFYRGINTSNAVIERAPAVTGMDPAVKAGRIAEAKFLRALSYFWLVQMYGPVPLPLTESQGASNQAHRSPVDSVYLQMVQDLREAIPNLPATQSQFGRATKGAAQHLLAKVLLTRAYHPFAYEAANTGFYLSGPTFQREASATAATDFAAARAEADSVIAGPYALMPNYPDIFCAPMGARGPGSYCNVPSNESNSEIIFSVQFTTTAGQFNVGGGNSLFVQMLSFYDDRQGMTRDCNNGRAFRRARPTLFARNLWQRWTDSTYSTVLDTRYDGTFQSVWYANAGNTGACFQSQGAARMNGYRGSTCGSGGLPTFGVPTSDTATVPNCTNGQPFSVGDTAMFQPGRLVGQAVRQSAKYAIYEPCMTEPCPNQTTVGQYDIFRFPTMKKWQDEARPDFNNLDGGRDIILMRLGETYLIAAEAALGAGDGPGARAYLVTLRQRAANCRGCAAEAANRALIVDATHMPATIDLEYIMDERGREMYGELTRWLDLARTSLWHRVVDDNWQASQLHGGFFNEAKHHLRPIPQNQIDLTAGGTQA
ncbi:MAG TPA: RagB/SusD family nutrient uptake outer membrane protein, partial [Amycolatopsis sp.]|nr:RagB/SusD family nutrient uptake outer membrane protein [Amycolatopsis sp.]